LKECQNRLQEAESAAMKSGKRVITKLEAKIREIEAQLDGEARRNQDAEKNMRKMERMSKELLFQCDEDKKGQQRGIETLEKMQQRIRSLQRQLEEAEAQAATKFQQISPNATPHGGGRRAR